MATQAQQAKVLRIGIIVDGKIVQERLIKAGENVTIGDSPKNTFPMPKLGLPKQDWPLFVHKGGKYFLNFTDGMKGKVGAGGAVTGLDKVRTDPSVEKEGAGWKLPLAEQDRGKIAIDNVTVLFQFVSPPPVAAVRPARMDFRPRLVEEDDALLFGFLLLFAALGAIFVVWARFVHIEEEITSIEEIDEKWTKLIIQEPPEPPPTPTEAPGDTKVEEPEETKAETKQDPGDGAKQKTQSERREAAKEDLKKKSLVLQYLTTRGDSSSGSQKDLWSEAGDVDAVAGALEGADGVAVADEGNVGIRNTGKGGPGGEADIGELGQIGGDGGAVQVETMKVEVAVDLGEGEADEMEQTDQATVKKTVQRNYGQLKYCYENQLKKNPDLSGRVEIEWNISGGRVTSAAVFANTTGDQELATCIVSKVKRWTFPTEIEGEVLWPFIFRQKT